MGFVIGVIFVKKENFLYKLLADLKYKYSDINNYNFENKLKKKYPNWNSINLNHSKIIIKDFKSRINIYSDRNYFNHENDKYLLEFKLLQLPRHNNEIKKFSIYFPEETLVVRVTCNRNNNSEYKNWSRFFKNFMIIGNSCIHDRAYSKKFKKGYHVFYLGGPIATDPFFFISKNKQGVKLEY